jgi:8-oxo-dGTP diphosphatase
MNEARPLIGIGVVIQKEDQILVGKRLRGHGSGTYQIPGGHFEFGETFEQCAIREVLEETGLKIDDLSLVSVSNDIAYEKHYVSLGMHAMWKEGEPTAMEIDAASEWNWIDPHKLPDPMFSHSKKVVENWLSKKIYNP